MVFGLVGKGTVTRTLDLWLMKQEKLNNEDRTAGVVHHSRSLSSLASHSR